MTAESVDVLIIGAGAYGLSAAWSMAERRSGARILVVDALDFAGGGTGRNGAGFRMQWGLECNIRLCRESIAFFEEAAERLDYPRGIDLRQEGYLILSHDSEGLQRFEDHRALQHSFGVPSELLSPEDCRRVVPGLNIEGLAGAAFCPKDGSASPFLWLDALLTASRRLGVEVRFHTRILRLESAGSAFRAETETGAIEAAKVLVCTDWAVSELLSPLGIDLPVSGVPKEVVVTEACAPTFGTVVVSLSSDMTLRQVARGNFVITRTLPRAEGSDIASTPEAVGAHAEAALALLPGLADLHVLRSWAGVYSKTPDMQAVLGETEIDGLFLAVSAYKGFMTSPAVGRIMGELVLDGGSQDPALSRLQPRRFADGDLVPDPLTV